MDGQPDPADQPVQWVTMSLLRLLQFRLGGRLERWAGGSGRRGTRRKDRPSVLDGLRLMRRHRGRIQRFLSKREGNGENYRGRRGA